MLEAYLVQSCQFVAITRNKYGDITYSGVATESCRWRDNLELTRGQHQDFTGVDIDAVMWLGPDGLAEVGSIYKFNSRYYQVEKIILARKLGSDVVEFMKCGMKINDIAIS